jgi:purine-binding chemotaxis protein CheW
MNKMNELAAGQRLDEKNKAGSRQVLTFTLGSEIYAVDILRVREIRGWSPVTPLPQTPEYVLGVLNLRGSVVPIFDLRRRFQQAGVEFTASTVIVRLTVTTAAGSHEFGLVVDGVSAVVDIPAENIRESPHLGPSGQLEFIECLATSGANMLILLDVDALFGRGSGFDDTLHCASAA